MLTLQLSQTYWNELQAKTQHSFGPRDVIWESPTYWDSYHLSKGKQKYSNEAINSLLSQNEPSYQPADVINREPILRRIWKSLTIYSQNVKALINDTPPSEPLLRPRLKAIHIKAVNATILSYKVNRVLNSHSPPMAHKETKLSRSRVTFVQLRSGNIKELNSYMSKLDQYMSELLIRQKLS